MEILKKPLITEKSQKLQDKAGKYTFIVDKKANKIEIKKTGKTLILNTVLRILLFILNLKWKIINRNQRKYLCLKMEPKNSSRFIGDPILLLFVMKA